MTLDQLLSLLRAYGEQAWTYLSQPAIGIQLGLVLLLYLPAAFVARRVVPMLESRARNLRGWPGLLRVIVAFLARMKWLFFAVVLALAYLITGALQWPDNNFLLLGSTQLAAAWLVISTVSHVIRSRALGKAFSIVAWAYVALIIFGISDDIGSLLDSAGFSMGERRISVLTVLQGGLLIGLLLWVALGVGNFVDRRIQAIDELTPSLRVLLGKILRISLLVLAVLLAMSSLGIQLAALTVLSGAVGVGIGFGLQKVVSNFISGIIILLDQSIKPGDTITLGETFGWIRELRARFVSVITRDGREFLIPNEDFITREVVNWSFSDEYVRLDVPFGVAYSSDPHKVSRLAIEAAGGVDRVSTDHKAPVCWMTEFGDSSLNFLLRFWIRDPQQGLTNIRGKVLLALWDTFQEHQISIPFPHREVIMRTPLEVTTTASACPKD